MKKNLAKRKLWIAASSTTAAALLVGAAAWCWQANLAKAGSVEAAANIQKSAKLSVTNSVSFPTEGKYLRLINGQVLLDWTLLPIEGNPAAARQVVVTTDPMAREENELREALELLPAALAGEVNVVWVPGFRDQEGMDIQQLFLALRDISQESSEKITDQWRKKEIAHSVVTLREAIATEVGGAVLEAKLSQRGRAYTEFLREAGELVDANDRVAGRSILPQVRIGSQVFTGAADSLTAYVTAAATEFRIPLNEQGQALIYPLSQPESVIDLGEKAAGSLAEVELTVRNLSPLSVRGEALSMSGPVRLHTAPPDVFEPQMEALINLYVTIPETPGPFSCEVSLPTPSGPDAPLTWVIQGVAQPPQSTLPAVTGAQ